VEITAETAGQSLEILDQHRVGRVRAAGEGQAAVAGPVERENLVRSEMRHWVRRTARATSTPDGVKSFRSSTR